MKNKIVAALLSALSLLGISIATASSASAATQQTSVANSVDYSQVFGLASDGDVGPVDTVTN
jgi:hypothetical protein